MRIIVLVSAALGITLAGCGPSGTLASFNPTRDVVMVRVGALEEAVAPGETRLMRWRGSPLEISVYDEQGVPIETVQATPAKGDRRLLHHVGGERCFGVADFGPLYTAGSDGALGHVESVGPGSWLALGREITVWPGQRLPIYTEEDEVWGAVEVPCAMTVDAANTHAAIQARLHELEPK